MFRPLRHEAERGEVLLPRDLGDVLAELFLALPRVAGSSFGFHHAEHARGRVVETEIGDAVPRRWVVAFNRHLETDLGPVTQLPACREQLRVDEQGTRLGFVQFHWRSPRGNSGPRRILFGLRSSDFTALGPAPTNSWGMVYSGPPGSARRILIHPAPSRPGYAAAKQDAGLKIEDGKTRTRDRIRSGRGPHFRHSPSAYCCQCHCGLRSVGNCLRLSGCAVRRPGRLVAVGRGGEESKV